MPHIILEYAGQLAGLSPVNIQTSVITVEIIDMDRDFYAKAVPK